MQGNHAAMAFEETASQKPLSSAGIGIAKGAYTEKEFLELTEKLSFPPFEKSFD